MPNAGSSGGAPTGVPSRVTTPIWLPSGSMIHPPSTPARRCCAVAR
ncbi:hypothetical protein [Micromonospora sp. NPDC092111]